MGHHKRYAANLASYMLELVTLYHPPTARQACTVEPHTRFLLLLSNALQIQVTCLVVLLHPLFFSSFFCVCGLCRQIRHFSRLMTPHIP